MTYLTRLIIAITLGALCSGILGVVVYALCRISKTAAEQQKNQNK